MHKNPLESKLPAELLLIITKCGEMRYFRSNSFSNNFLSNQNFSEENEAAVAIKILPRNPLETHQIRPPEHKNQTHDYHTGSPKKRSEAKKRPT